MANVRSAWENGADCYGIFLKYTKIGQVTLASDHRMLNERGLGSRADGFVKER